MKKRAMTLIEVLVSILIAALLVSAVFSVYPVLFEGVNISSQEMIAWGLARTEMETLKNTGFETLLSAGYDPQTENPKINLFSTASLANSSGVYYVKKMIDSQGQTLDDLLEIEVVVCFKIGNRFIGEDKNLNSSLDGLEDSDSNHRISSPITLRTLVRQSS